MKMKEARENRSSRGCIHQPLCYVSRKFSVPSKRYKKLATQDEVEEPRSFFSKSKSQDENTRPRSSSKDFDDFVENRCKGAPESSKFNSIALDGEGETDREKEPVRVRCRRHAICEEMERNIWNDAGVNLRGYREILVTRRLLYEMHLL